MRCIYCRPQRLKFFNPVLNELSFCIELWMTIILLWVMFFYVHLRIFAIGQ